MELFQIYGQQGETALINALYASGSEDRRMSSKAGQVEFSDYYFPTNLYPTPPVAKLRPF